MIGIKYINKVIASQKGTAILIVMALIAMLTSVAIMSVNRSTTDIDLSFNALHEDKAFYVAEAGMQRALAELNRDNAWRAGFYKQVLDGGYYNISMVDSLTDSTLSDTVLMTAKGYYDQSITNLEVWITPVYIYPFKYAMFGEAGIEMRQFACTDSYNSDSGSYAATADTVEGHLGSNGPIIVMHDATIGGDVTTATDGALSIADTGNIYGDTSSTADSVTLDTIPDSEFDWAESVSNAPGGLSGSSYNYNPGQKSLQVNAGGDVELTDGVYFFSRIQLNGGSKLTIAPGASVTIYITGNLILTDSSTMNDGGSPTDMIIYSKGLEFSMFEGSQFYGAFYGPNTTFKARQNSSLYGSVVASSATLHQYACMHYDRELSKIKKGTTGEMNVVAWRQY